MHTVQNEENLTQQSITEQINDQKKIPVWKKFFNVLKTLFYSIVTLILLLKVLSWIGIDLVTPIDNLISQLSEEQKYIDLVRDGHFQARPNQKIGDAFDKFFGSPKWTAFDSESGQKIVEFTGDFKYQQQTVKARMQFIVDPEKGSFEIHTIGFNDIPQNQFMQAALLAKVFEGKEITVNERSATESNVSSEQQSSPSTTNTTTVENTASPTINDSSQQQSPQATPRPNGDTQLIEEAMYSYLIEIPNDTIGNIFNDTLFSDISWSENNGEIIFTGNYRGEIVEGKPSNLQFTFSFNDDGKYYHISNLKFNGEDANQEGIDYIVNMISSALQ